jgi:hypothetical protein
MGDEPIGLAWLMEPDVLERIRQEVAAGFRREQAARTSAAAPALLAMLLRLEWGMDKDGWLSCPMCFVPKSHDYRVPSLHAKDCALAALLDPLR